MAKLFPDTASRGRWPERPEANPVLSSEGQASEIKVETITATGGTRTLTFNGQTTSALAFDATASTIQTALEALSNLAPGDVGVSGTGGSRTYSFGGAYAKTPVTLVVNTGSLTGGSSSIVTTQVGGALSNNVKTALETNITREITQQALASKGLLRQPSQVQNELEQWAMRKPKDIGEVGRIPGEK